MRLFNIALSSAVSLLLPAVIVEESLAARMRAAGEGRIPLSFAARPEVCGDGHGMVFRNAGDQDDEWQSECEHGPVRVSLRVRGGHVTSEEVHVLGLLKQVYVGVDLDMVSAPESARVLL